MHHRVTEGRMDDSVPLQILARMAQNGRGEFGVGFGPENGR
jgi:hypothetical protein